MFELSYCFQCPHPHCGSRLAYTEPRPGVPQFTSTGINFCSEPNFEAVPCATCKRRGNQLTSDSRLLCLVIHSPVSGLKNQ
jgi:hypothetical protein